jgi:vacuolar-type H+-ATPase subunit E/Vma4
LGNKRQNKNQAIIKMTYDELVRAVEHITNKNYVDSLGLKKAMKEIVISQFIGAITLNEKEEKLIRDQLYNLQLHGEFLLND